MIVLITGMSMTGKSRIAYKAAKKTGSVIFNGDHLRTAWGYPICSGAIDRKFHSSVKHELYEFRSPLLPRMDAGEFVEAMVATSKGYKNIIVDNMCNLYLKEWIKRGLPGKVLGIKQDPRENIYLKSYLRARLALLIGMMKEVKYGPRGPFRIDLLVPGVFERTITRELTKGEAINICINNYALGSGKKLEELLSFPEIEWIDRKDAVQRIQKLMEET